MHMSEKEEVPNAVRKDVFSIRTKILIKKNIKTGSNGASYIIYFIMIYTVGEELM